MPQWNPSVASQKLEHLNPLVHLVGHINSVLRVNKNAGRKAEGAGLHPEAAHKEQEFTFGVEDLDIAEGHIHYIQVPFAIYGHALGPIKHTWAISVLADAFEEFEVLVEYLHAKIHGVADVDPSLFVHCHIRGEKELVVLRSFTAKRRSLAKLVQIGNMDLVARGIRNYQPVPGFIQRYAGGVHDRFVADLADGSR